MKIWLIIFLVFTVSHDVQSQTRLVVNTTCLELVKPSNQQFRLICSQNDYHCLLDETFTKEFEVCREWKWIPGGKCAYFNTYGSGNVDERQCNPGINLTCSESGHQFESKTNAQFTACYAKRYSSTQSFTTTMSPEGKSNKTSDGEIATSSPAPEAWIIILLVIIGIFVILSILVIFFIHKRKGNMTQREDEERGTSRSGLKSRNVETDKGTKVLPKASESLPLKGPTVDDTCKRQIRDEEKSEDSTSGLGTDQVKKYHKNEDKQRITNLSDGSVDSLKMIEPPTGEQDKEQCSILYTLLTEGLELTQEILTAVFKKETGKSAKMLLKNLKDQEKDKLNEVMPEKCRRILDSEEEREKSLHVSYGLHRIYLDEKHQPKSGWGNPVKETDFGIGDDVERLYSLYTTIEDEIQDPVKVSIESYTRMLDIIVKALTRLDPGAELNKKLKKLEYKIILTKAKNYKKAVICTLM